MVAILVLATFLTMMGVDYVLHKDKYNFAVAGGGVAQSVPGVAGVTVPSELSYHPGHTWAVLVGAGRIRVGIDDFAATLLGDIDHIELPKRGRWLQQGDHGWMVVTRRGVAWLPAPADGEVVAINERALTEPEIVSVDPYNSGWLLELRSPDLQISFRNLLSGSLAVRWMEDAVDNVKHLAGSKVKALRGRTVELPHNLGNELPEEEWSSVTSQLFRC